MTLQGQYGLVLAGLLICLALTIGLVQPPPPVPQASPAGGDDIPVPTLDVPAWDSKVSSARPRVPNSMVPEGVAVLVVTVIWTACRGLLSGKLGHRALRRAVTISRRQRSFG